MLLRNVTDDNLRSFNSNFPAIEGAYIFVFIQPLKFWPENIDAQVHDKNLAGRQHRHIKSHGHFACIEAKQHGGMDIYGEMGKARFYLFPRLSMRL